MGSPRATLKGYFETGDKPTQTQFADLIDSIPNNQDDGFYWGSEVGITAHAGGGQADASPLTYPFNVVSVCASDNDSVRFDQDFYKGIWIVKNQTAKALAVYPDFGGTIAGLALDEAYPVSAGQCACFVQVSSTSYSLMFDIA